LVGKNVTEFSVERTAVRDESAGLGNVTNKTHLGGLELVGVLNPTHLVVGKRVDKLVGLVHLPLGLLGLFLKGVLRSHLGVELLAESSLKGINLSELVGGFL
jgi:hypothetical protein